MCISLYIILPKLKQVFEKAKDACHYLTHYILLLSDKNKVFLIDLKMTQFTQIKNVELSPILSNSQIVTTTFIESLTRKTKRKADPATSEFLMNILIQKQEKCQKLWRGKKTCLEQVISFERLKDGFILSTIVV